MKYNCPICGVEMSESNFCNMRSCRECHLSIEVKVLDAIADKDTRIAVLEKERDAKDARIAELKNRIDGFTHEISGGGWLCDQ